jgi:hypothetical protein
MPRSSFFVFLGAQADLSTAAVIGAQYGRARSSLGILLGLFGNLIGTGGDRRLIGAPMSLALADPPGRGT